MITTVIYFFSAINILLALMLVTYNWRINKNILFLCVFLILLSLESTMVSIFNFGGNLTLYTNLFIISPLFFLKGPMLYFFVRGIVHDKFYIKKTDLLHFIPFVLHLWANIPFLLMSYEQQYDLSASIMQNFDFFREVRFTIYPISWNNGARAIQMFAYVIAAFLLMRRVKLRLHRLKGQIKYQYSYTIKRMTVLLILVLLITIMTILAHYMFTRFFDKTAMIDYMYLLLQMIMYVYFLIPVFVILSPKFLYGLPHLETKHVSAMRFDEPDEMQMSSPESKEMQPKQAEYYAELSKKIMDYIENEKPYLNKDFQIKDICVRFLIPQHHVHFCLNEILKTDFHELKNEHRIAYAKSLIKENSVDVEEVGYVVGFTSKSAFELLFKKYTGMTPLQWVRQNKNQMPKG